MIEVQDFLDAFQEYVRLCWCELLLAGQGGVL